MASGRMLNEVIRKRAVSKTDCAEPASVILQTQFLISLVFFFTVGETFYGLCFAKR